jgi:hypothetical protein
LGLAAALALAYYESLKFERGLVAAFADELGIHIDQSPVDMNDMRGAFTSRPILYLLIVGAFTAVALFWPSLSRLVKRASS